MFAGWDWALLWAASSWLGCASVWVPRDCPPEIVGAVFGFVVTHSHRTFKILIETVEDASGEEEAWKGKTRYGGVFNRGPLEGGGQDGRMAGIGPFSGLWEDQTVGLLDGVSPGVGEFCFRGELRPTFDGGLNVLEDRLGASAFHSCGLRAGFEIACGEAIPVAARSIPLRAKSGSYWNRATSRPSSSATAPMVRAKSCTSAILVELALGQILRQASLGQPRPNQLKQGFIGEVGGEIHVPKVALWALVSNENVVNGA